MISLIKELYSYREMIVSLVRRDLKGRYKGSILGFLWTFLNPLLQLVVYTMVFSLIMRSGIEEYYLFLFVVLVPWIFFSTSLTGGASCIWSQKELVKKIYFPREILPISFVTSQFVNMLLSFLVIFLVLIVSAHPINLMALCCLPLFWFLEYLLALSVAMLSSAITVYLRDFEYILAIVAMAWQFLTPVMYSVEQVPEEILMIFQMNPLTPVMVAYRDILYYAQVPKLETLLHAFLLGILLFMIGVVSFGRLKRHFAEEL